MRLDKNGEAYDMKVKVIEMLNAYSSLIKLSNNDAYYIPLQFKFKLALVIKDVELYISEYQKQLNDLLKKYNVIFEEGKFIDGEAKKEPNESFTKELIKIQYEYIELPNEKIKFDNQINGISASDLLTLMPFFDYEDIE